MVTPYSEDQCTADQTGKLAHFNRKHLGARVEMTEDTIGIWKRRFPIIRWLRLKLNNAMKVVLATAILHNISIEWGEIMPDHEHPDGLMFPDMPDAGDVIVVDQLNLREQRLVRQHNTRLSPREFGQSPAPFSGLVRPAVYSTGVLAWDGKGLLKLICVYYGIREKLSS